MHFTRTWFFGILLGVCGLGGIAVTVNAQSWQPARTTDDGRNSWQTTSDAGESTPIDWEQRTIRKPLSWKGKNGQTATSAPSSRKPMQEARASAPESSYRPIRRTSYDQPVISTAPVVNQPPMRASPQVRSGETVVPEPIPRGMELEPLSTDGPMADAVVPGGYGGDCGESCEPCCECGGCGCGECCPDWPVFNGNCGPWLRGLSIFAGGDAFKGPLDRGTNGNFGVNEGLNLARPLGDPWGCGYQIGANFVQSDFSGAKALVADESTTVSAPYRKQYFATAAIFRRAECRGFQWGVAYDYLHDIYVSNANLQQIRSETSYVFNSEWEFGYFGAYGVSTDRDPVLPNGKLDPSDMFCLFLRKTFECGGDGRIWGGATGNGDGLLGADLWIPLGRNFALQNEINYRIPKRGTNDSVDTNTTPRESWGFVMQLVWYPGQRATCERQNPYRPLFNVADNSLFMVDRLAH